MIELKLNIFQWIYDFFSFLFERIVSTISNIATLLAILSSSVNWITVLIGVFGGFIGISITLVLVVSVIKLVLGWGNT